jgi:hypothetical protein
VLVILLRPVERLEGFPFALRSGRIEMDRVCSHGSEKENESAQQARKLPTLQGEASAEQFIDAFKFNFEPQIFDSKIEQKEETGSWRAGPCRDRSL